MVTVLLPNLLKLLQGLFALITSFIIVISSDGVIELFKEFSALSIISYIDNVSFKLCEEGIFGSSFVRQTERVQDIKLRRHRIKEGHIPLQSVLYCTLVVILYTCWAVFVQRQFSHTFFRSKYPQCLSQQNTGGFYNTTFSKLVSQVGNGRCDSWSNKIECGLYVYIPGFTETFC